MEPQAKFPVITLTVELAPGRDIFYEIEKTGEGQYKYARKERGGIPVIKTLPAKHDSNEDTSHKNWSNSLELLVAMFTFNGTEYPLFGFLLELLNLLWSLFASEGQDLSNIIPQHHVLFPDDTELEEGFQRVVGQAVSWVKH
jgi:hypothetical protein